MLGKWSKGLWAREASQGKKDRKLDREPRSYRVGAIIPKDRISNVIIPNVEIPKDQNL